LAFIVDNDFFTAFNEEVAVGKHLTDHRCDRRTQGILARGALKPSKPSLSCASTTEPGFVAEDVIQAPGDRGGTTGIAGFRPVALP
jgi:hypothetical protein